MTPRSPKTSKTTTISRRLRTRADQNFSVQPPELPQLRNLRSRRAATLASHQRPPVTSQLEEQYQSVWDPTEILDDYPRGNTSDPNRLAVPSSTDSNLLLPHLELTPHHSPHQSTSALSPLSNQLESDQFQLPSHSSDSNFIPSHLPPLSIHRSPGEYEIRLSTEPEHHSDQSVELQDMSTLGFMVAPQYGSLDHYGSPASLDSHNYSAMSHQQQPHSSSGYVPSYTTSPGLQSQPRSSGDHAVLPPYQASHVPRSPYQQPLASLRQSPTPMGYPPNSNDSSATMTSQPHSYSYPALQPSLPGQGLGSLNTTSSYPPPSAYPPTTYDMGYSSLPTSIYPSSSTAAYSPYGHTGLAPPSSNTTPGLSSSPGDRGNGVRVLNSRPKPQCWEHGCNGRQFSTFSNLLRHQREKSGTAAKSYCPRCGAEFTRTTARNGHMAHEKCKPRRTSDSSR